MHLVATMLERTTICSRASFGFNGRRSRLAMLREHDDRLATIGIRRNSIRRFVIGELCRPMFG